MRLCLGWRRPRWLRTCADHPVFATHRSRAVSGSHPSVSRRDVETPIVIAVSSGASPEHAGCCRCCDERLLFRMARLIVRASRAGKRSTVSSSTRCGQILIAGSA
jgi:hypothetical protein